MDFGGLLVLGIVWLIFNLLSQARGGSRPKPTGLPQRQGPRPDGPAGAGTPPDATQREGSRLEQFLRELERNLEQAGGTRPAPSSRAPVPAPRPPAPSLPGAEEVEERESLEEPARVVSLETDVPRRGRPVYDQDTGAEELVRRRIEAARTRDRAHTRADHQAFDARIRQEPADHTAVRRYTQAQLRDAIVWREILGPPVSEREE